MKDPDPESQSGPAAPEPGGLKFAEQFLIWAFRVWGQAHGADAANSHHHFGILRTSFELAGIADALAVFDRLMTLVVATRTREIGLHAPRCRGVGADEIMMLRIVGDAQRGSLDPAGVAGLTGNGADRRVYDAIVEFAGCLACRGMEIRSLELAAAAERPAAAKCAAADGAGTLH